MAAHKSSGSGASAVTVVCVGTVVLQGERALFVRQAKGHPLEGLWSIPWGILDPGESPDAAALRETLEEGGVAATAVGLLGVQNLRQEGWVAIIFLCRHVSGMPTPDGGIETDGAAYFSLEEMDAFDEPFEPWCEWLVHRVLRGEHHIIPGEPDNPYLPRTAFF
jgi:ADP-ribose pyrophosphatase YjhB (NUDIX family)